MRTRHRRASKRHFLFARLQLDRRVFRLCRWLRGLVTTASCPSVPTACLSAPKLSTWHPRPRCQGQPAMLAAHHHTRETSFPCRRSSWYATEDASGSSLLVCPSAYHDKYLYRDSDDSRIPYTGHTAPPQQSLRPSIHQVTLVAIAQAMQSAQPPQHATHELTSKTFLLFAGLSSISVINICDHWSTCRQPRLPLLQHSHAASPTLTLSLLAHRFVLWRHLPPCNPGQTCYVPRSDRFFDVEVTKVPPAASSSSSEAIRRYTNPWLKIPGVWTLRGNESFDRSMTFVSAVST